MNTQRSRQPWQLRDEIGRARELDVDAELLLQLWDRPQQGFGFAFELEVDVDCRRAPAHQDRRRSAGEVHLARLSRVAAEALHEGMEPRDVGQRPHSAARSKLTSLRINAL